jgi:hypothetical protein
VLAEKNDLLSLALSSRGGEGNSTATSEQRDAGGWQRLAPRGEAIFAALQREGVAGMVVNGSCEEDWPEVLALARLCHTTAAAEGGRRIPAKPKMAPTDGRVAQAPFFREQAG